MKLLKLFRSILSRTVSLVKIGGVVILATGCDKNGNLSDVGQPPAGQQSTVDDRNLSALAGPTDRSQLRPVSRLSRAQYGRVGPFPLQESDLNVLFYPDFNDEEKAATLEGLDFFTRPHTPEEGAGPVANQPFCLGCHRSSDDALSIDENGNQIVTTISLISRAGRSTPTNFDYTSFDPATGGGRAADNLDAVTNTGQTAAFTLFGDFSPSSGSFDGLEPFSGVVQHTRPSIPACLPDPILPLGSDPNLRGGIDPVTGLSPLGVRRAVAERAGPPYIGRGLMEAIFDQNILETEDPNDTTNNPSSLAADFPECRNDCISGRHNEGNSSAAFTGGDPIVRLGRFGLRAAGPTILQFVVGGAQGELGFTNPFSLGELNNNINVSHPGCPDSVGEPELPDSALISCRALIRMTAPPEFGSPLLTLMQSPDPNATQVPESAEAMVQRGAQLFGVDLVAFSNRMIPGRMPAGGDGLNDHAFANDRMVDCAGCHIPVHATGQSPAETGARHLSNVWAPIFSDLLLHAGPVINAERFAPTPRRPLQISRTDSGGRRFNTFDLPRNLADDALPNQGVASGADFRTPPLMGMGIMGPPFLHDARVYLSKSTVNTTPAGTVTTNSTATNAPLVVRTLEDAILATIELHDLPAPDDGRTPAGGGCPVPAGNVIGDVHYTGGKADVCPPYNSATSQSNRSEARKVIRRFRGLSPQDQQALIAFLKQL